MGGRFDYDAFEFVQKELKACKQIKDYGQEMIHSLYPDCLDKDMDDEDPRKNFLDASKQTKLANYAFPLGFVPKFGRERPQHKLLPMDMHAANDNSYI